MSGFQEYKPTYDSYQGQAGEIKYDYETEIPGTAVIADYSYTPAAPKETVAYIAPEVEV